VLVTLTVGLNACGDDGDENSAGNSNANRAFLEAMIPHHESAIEMANVAKRRAEHPEVRGARQAHRQYPTGRDPADRAHPSALFDQRILPNPAAHEGLGLSAQEAGMAHMEPTAALADAKPFDKAFIDEMVPHHQGAIRMARVVLEETEDDETRSLAEAIVRTQSDEIEQMNDWRGAWYGDVSPAGGAPEDDAVPNETDSMEEHEGH
jgi:uncharacterized protein (DUF305 family)